MKVLEDKLEDKAIDGCEMNSKIEEKNSQLTNIKERLLQYESENTKLVRENNRLTKLMNECNKNIKSMTKYGSSFKLIDEQLNSQRSKTSPNRSMTPNKEGPAYMLNSINDGRIDIDLLAETNKDLYKKEIEDSKFSLG